MIGIHCLVERFYSQFFFTRNSLQRINTGEIQIFGTAIGETFTRADIDSNTGEIGDLLV